MLLKSMKLVTKLSGSELDRYDSKRHHVAARAWFLCKFLMSRGWKLGLRLDRCKVRMGTVLYFTPKAYLPSSTF